MKQPEEKPSLPSPPTKEPDIIVIIDGVRYKSVNEAFVRKLTRKIADQGTEIMELKKELGVSLNRNKALEKAGFELGERVKKATEIISQIHLLTRIKT